jgi:outer membrane lipoprotein-sorting protein
LSKKNIEEQLSDYIDALNNEREPEATNNDQEFEKLQATVRLVRTLREPILPEEGYPKRLAQAVASKIQKEEQASLRKPAKSTSKSIKGILLPMTALAAGLLMFAIVNWLGFFNQDVVYAMEKAVAQLSSYHGILEMRTKNAAGEEWLVRRVELWYEGDKYAIKQDDGTLTVNNGQQKWQINHENKEVVLLPLLLDPTRSSFDLRDEAKLAKQYPHTVVGTELIAGREAIKLAISPPGGEEYYLWVDTETNLPIQLETAMQKALQTTYTFVSFEPNTKIHPEIFAYQVPEGYTVVENDPGQLVATIEEAAAISGFLPLLPEQAPIRIFAFEDRIVLDYGDTTIMETIPKGDFELAPNASLGSAAGGPLEIWHEQLRWRQERLEIQVEGAKRVELASQIAADLAIPDVNQDLTSKAKVKVPVDIEIVEANQKQVDSGSSPWQLDPLQVSLTFVNLKVTPEGIQGEPKIPMSSFKLVTNNSVEAVVEVDDGPIERVYLKRLVRQDETGIWTVVGYDPR